MTKDIEVSYIDQLERAQRLIETIQAAGIKPEVENDMALVLAAAMGLRGNVEDLDWMKLCAWAWESARRVREHSDTAEP